MAVEGKPDIWFCHPPTHPFYITFRLTDFVSVSIYLPLSQHPSMPFLMLALLIVERNEIRDSLASRLQSKSPVFFEFKKCDYEFKWHEDVLGLSSIRTFFMKLGT